MNELPKIEEKIKPSPKKRRLTGKQQAFIDNYLTNGFNATQAVKQAQYKPKNYTTQRSIATENLAKPLIKEEIESRTKRISVEWIAERLSKEAEGMNASDRIRALELLGKWKAMFKEKDTNIAVFQNISQKELEILNE